MSKTARIHVALLLAAALIGAARSAAALGPASAAWGIECEGESQVFYGTLTVGTPEQLDSLRCYRKVTGNLVLDAASTVFSSQLQVVALPWIEEVGGDVQVVGTAENFAHFRLPRLSLVGGRIQLDYRPAFESLHVPSLAESGDLFVTMRTMNMSLSGLDAVQELGVVQLNNPWSGAGVTPTTYGLTGLERVGSLRILGYGIVRNGLPLMSSLVEVSGDVEVIGKHTEPWTGSDQIPVVPVPVYGTDSIETIGGNLELSHPDLQDFSAFGQLREIGGTLIVDPNTTPGLDAGEIQAFVCGLDQIGSLPPGVSCP